MATQKDKLTSTMRVLKKETCSSLSGVSSITYHIGCTPDAEIHFRIHTNSGGGFFSTEWVSLKAIQRALENVSPITSLAMHQLLRGKSSNTTGFLLAALVNEKLICPLKGKKRNHELLDPKDFMTKIDKLMSSTVNVKTKKTVKNPTKTSSKKTARRKKAKP